MIYLTLPEQLHAAERVLPLSAALSRCDAARSYRARRSWLPLPRPPSWMLTSSVPTWTRSRIRSRLAVTGESAEQRRSGLIDTSIVMHLAALDSAQLPAEMVISAITLAELSAGPHHADDPAERARRMSVLQHAESTFEPLPFDTDAARAFGLVVAAVLAAGRTTRRRVADLMIAAIALACRLPLYTTNPDDFAGLGGLVTVVPVRRPDPTAAAEAVRQPGD